jgi:hypothetical protein
MSKQKALYKSRLKQELGQKQQPGYLMEYFLCVLGMVMFLEGLPYFAFPNRLKTWLAKIAELPDGTLRTYGFLLMAAGVAVIYLAQR